MNDKVIRVAIIVAVVALVIGVLSKLMQGPIVVAARTWHMFAQTSLLFAIAWGVGRWAPKGSSGS